MVRNAKNECYSTCDKTKSLISRLVSHCDNYCHPKSLINSADIKKAIQKIVKISSAFVSVTSANEYLPIELDKNIVPNESTCDVFWEDVSMGERNRTFQTKRGQVFVTTNYLVIGTACLRQGSTRNSIYFFS